MRAVGKHDQTDRPDRERYSPWLDHPDPAVVANALIWLIHQANYLLDRQIAGLERQFITEGGYRRGLRVGFDILTFRKSQHLLAQGRFAGGFRQPPRAGRDCRRDCPGSRVGAGAVSADCGGFGGRKSRIACFQLPITSDRNQGHAAPSHHFRQIVRRKPGHPVPAQHGGRSRITDFHHGK